MFLLEVSLFLQYKMKFGQNGVKKTCFHLVLPLTFCYICCLNNYTVCKLNMEIKGRNNPCVAFAGGCFESRQPWKKQEYVLETEGAISSKSLFQSFR